MSTSKAVFIHSGGDRLRLKMRASSTCDAGRKMTSPQKLTTTKKLSPSSVTRTICSLIRIQSPTPNGLVTKIMMSVRNIVAAVVPKTNANASSADDVTSQRLATSTRKTPSEMNSVTVPSTTAMSTPTLFTRLLVSLSVFPSASRSRYTLRIAAEMFASANARTPESAPPMSKNASSTLSASTKSATASGVTNGCPARRR